MSPYVSVNAGEIGLVEHGELEFLGFFGGYGCRDYEVKGSLEDGRVGDRVDGVKGEEFEGFFEAPDNAGREEEEEAWRF